MDCIVRNLRNIPLEITNDLQSLRSTDKLCKSLNDSICESEEKLFEQLVALQKAGDHSFDDQPLLEEYQRCFNIRAEALNLHESQSKLIQNIYDRLDKKIALFGKLMKC